MKNSVEKKSVKGFVVTELAVVATAVAILLGLLLPGGSDGTGGEQLREDPGGVAWVSGKGGVR